MLESFAATFLNKFLGSYVENFDANQLEVGIWNGDVKLKNCKIKKDCLDSLDLPISIEQGILGNLTMQVPWSRLKSSPVKIEIDDIYLLIRPNSWENYDPTEAVKREFNRKMNKLEELEMINQNSSAFAEGNTNEEDKETAGNDKNSDGFTTSLINKIVDNVQVSIKNIHIRYEDFDCVFSREQTTIGIFLQNLSASTCNENWEEVFIETVKDISRKIVNLDNLGFYIKTGINTGDSLLDEDVDVFISRFRETVVEPVLIEQLIHPISGACKLSINKKGSTKENPRFKADLDFDTIGLEIYDSQYQILLDIMTNIKRFSKSWKFKDIRPQSRVMQNPREWMKYTINCVLTEITDKNKQYTWENMQEFSNLRREYIDCWKKKLLAQRDNVIVDKEVVDKLDELHKSLSLDDIMLFRSLTKKQILKDRKLAAEEKSNESVGSSPLTDENINEENMVTAPEEPIQSAQPKGWLAFWWGTADNGKSTQDSLELTEEQKKEFYDAIEYDENNSKPHNKNIAKDVITLNVTNNIKSGFLRLKTKAKNETLSEFTFVGAKTKFYQKPESFGFNFELNSFSIMDKSSSATYSSIVKCNSVLNDNTEAVDDFFKVYFEKNPIDKVDADSALTIKLNTMSIYYNPHFIKKVVQFFNTSDELHDTLSAIIASAGTTVEGWTQQTRIGLESVLEEHKNIDLNLDLKAPLIILPIDSNKWDSACVLLDAGNIKITSDLISKSIIEDIKNLSVEEYNHKEKEHPGELERFMFDRFKINLTNTQLLVGPDIKTTIESLKQYEKGTKNNWSVINNSTLDILFDVSIFPKALEYSKFKMQMVLPHLNLELSDYQYRILLQVAQVFGFQPTPDDEVSVGQLNLHTNKSMQKFLKDTKEFLSKLSKNQLKQKQFEMNVEVGEVSLNLKKRMNLELDDFLLISSITGSNMQLSVDKYYNYMDVQFILHELLLTENTTGQLKKMLYCTDAEKDQSSDLFKVAYKREQRIVQYNGFLIDVYDQFVDIGMSSLELNLNSSSIFNMLAYVRNTFTDVSNAPMPTDILKHNDDSNNEESPQKMIVNFDLEKINLIFEEMGDEKIAALSLSNSSLSVYMVPEKMKVSGKLKHLELVDLIYANYNPEIKNLISMDNSDGYSELKYETFDCENSDSDITSSLYLKTSSVKVKFMEQCFGRLVEYFNNLQNIKSVFDKARSITFNNSPDLNTIKKMKIDVIVESPIIEFPSIINPVDNICDNLIVHLGKFALSNKFEADDLTSYTTSLTNMKVASYFNFVETTQFLHMIENLDIKLDMAVLKDLAISNDKTKHVDVTGVISNSELKLTNLQIDYVRNILKTVASTFTSKGESNLLYDENVEGKNKNLNNLWDVAMDANAVITPNAVYKADLKEKSSSIELSEPQSSSNENEKLDPPSFNFNLSIPITSLTLYDNTENQKTVDECSLTKIALNGTSLTFNKDPSAEKTLDFHYTLDSFAITDLRTDKENVHSDLIPLCSDSKHQVNIVYSENSDNHKRGHFILDNMRVILAVDYLIAMKVFWNKLVMSPVSDIDQEVVNVSAKSNITQFNDVDTDEGGITQVNKVVEFIKTHFTVEMLNPSIVLLANPDLEDSEAFVLKLEHLILDKMTDREGEKISMNLLNVGMFMCNMNTFDKSHIRLVDDFSSNFYYKKMQDITSLKLDVEDMIIRVALRDIRLGNKIFKKSLNLATTSGLFGSALAERLNEFDQPGIKFSREFKLALAKYAPSVLSTFTFMSDENQDISDYSGEFNQPDVLITDENFEIAFGGARLVIIGDVSELPMLDFHADRFNVTIKDWTTDLNFNSNMTFYTNVFNYSKSDWEPLIEPYTFSVNGFRGRKSETDPSTAAMNINIESENSSDITISHQSLKLLKMIPESLSLSTVSELVQLSRDETKPYKIQNDTGIPLEVWVYDYQDKSKKTNFTVIQNGESIPWEFEDWIKLRENLDTDNNNSTVVFKPVGDDYISTFKINTKTEIQTLFKLEPPINNIHSRIECTIRLNDEGVKVIHFASPLKFTNATSTDLQVFYNEYDSLVLKKNSTTCIPLDKVYDSVYQIKPIVDNADYSKSYAIFGWKDVVEASTTIKSKCYNDSTDEYFYFNVSCQYNPKERLAKVFPHMEIIISAPFMIENTLPVESHFNIVSKDTGENINFNLKSGDKLSIHNINFAEDMIFMKVFPFDTGYTPREYSLIQAPAKFNLAPENTIALTRREAGIVNELKLSLSYRKDLITGSTIIKTFAAFVILNKTSRPIYIKEKNKQNLFLCPVDTNEEDDTYSTIQMVSLENYVKSGSNDGKKKGLVQLKMNDTDWSSNISLNTVGKTLDITLPIASKTTGNEIGVSIEEGSGVFSDTKIITITPRYIVTNFTDTSLVFHETMCMAEFLLEKDQNIPIYKMSMNENKYCRIKMFDNDGKSEYSEPFELNMKSDIDYIKLKNPETGKHILIMIEKLIEGPAMFINLKNSQSQWPFSVRNFTENNFTIYQRDPRIRNYSVKGGDDNSEENIRQSADLGYYRYMKTFEPKKYSLTEYSIMPFSWDFPSAKDKKLIVEYGRLTRTINMEMIGSLKPMILNMGTGENDEPVIVEINILADGPCLALVLTKYNPEVSLYKINTPTISDNNKPPLPARRRSPGNTSLQRTDSSFSLNTNSEMESRASYNTTSSENNSSMKKVFKTPDTEKSDVSFLRVLVNISGVGVSIINKKLQEILYLKIKGVEVRYNASKFFKSVSWKLKWFQIDNQLFEDNFKHVLYPTVVSDRKQDMEKHPLLSGSITRVNDETTGMTYIKHATALIQELSLKLDEEFVIELLQFFDLINIPSSMLNNSDFDNKIGGSSSSYSDNFVVPYLDIVKDEADFDKESNDLGVSADDYYHLSLPKCTKKVERKNLHFENLHVQPTVFHFSFMRSESLQLRDNEMDLVALTQKKKASSFLNALYMTLGNISDAPVVLNSLIMENYKTSFSSLKESVVNHYNNEIYSQLLKLVGYADVLGNPIGLFNNLSNGVADIFYSPYQNGYYMNDRPEELGMSISKGGMSFLKKSVFGFSDSFAKFTGSVAKGLTAAVNDKNFQRERYLQQRKNRMSDDPNSFGSGFNSLVQGVASGFNGIATNPMEGAKKEGASGFFKGLGKGLVGMPTKTMIGILDMANNVSDGIKTSTGAYDPDNVYNSKYGHYENNVKNLRYPRYVSKGLAFSVDAMDGLIKPYDEVKAYGQYVLKTCNGGEFLYDNYVDHEYLPGNQRIVIVSEEHLVEYNLDSKKVTFVLEMEEMCKVGAPIDDGRQIIVRGKDRNSGKLCQGRFPIIDLKAKERILTKILLAQSKVIKNMDTQL